MDEIQEKFVDILKHLQIVRERIQTMPFEMKSFIKLYFLKLSLDLILLF